MAPYIKIPVFPFLIGQSDIISDPFHHSVPRAVALSGFLILCVIIDSDGILSAVACFLRCLLSAFKTAFNLHDFFGHLVYLTLKDNALLCRIVELYPSYESCCNSEQKTTIAATRLLIPMFLKTSRMCDQLFMAFPSYLQAFPYRSALHHNRARPLSLRMFY